MLKRQTPISENEMGFSILCKRGEGKTWTAWNVATKVSDFTALAIYFPPTQTAFDNDPDHTGYNEDNTFMPIEFVRVFNWDEWLTEYYSSIP